MNLISEYFITHNLITEQGFDKVTPELLIVKIISKEEEDFRRENINEGILAIAIELNSSPIGDN